MSVQELRFINETSCMLLETCDPYQVQLDLSKEFSLNEAYFGKEGLKGIQSAMHDCLNTIRIDRMIDITDYSVNKKLEKECEKAFGFKKIHIIWNDSALFHNSTGTLTGSRIVPYTKAAALRLFGKKVIVESPIGYYNKEHDLVCYICLDSNIFIDKNLTDEEAVAVLLHEIGHNFDYTLGSFLTHFTNIYLSINEIMNDPEITIDSNAIKKTVVIFQALMNISPVKGLFAWLMHIDTWLTSKIPSIGIFIRLGGDILNSGIALLSAAMLPKALYNTAKKLATDPALLLNTGISTLNSMLVRHGEYYADSFTASYGYGPQLTTALEKLGDKTSDLRGDLPVLNCFWSLAELEQELTSVLYVPLYSKSRRVVDTTGLHGSNQMRVKSIMNKLQAELKDPHVTPEMKKDIQRELDDIYAIYTEAIMKPNSEAVAIFRKFMDAYMNGRDKVPLLSKIVQKNRA